MVEFRAGSQWSALLILVQVHELFAKQFTSPAEESDNTLYISTNEGQQEIIRIFQKYDWPLDISVRTIGEEYNSTVLERELLASRYRLEGFRLDDIRRLAQTRFVDDNTQDYLTEVTNEVMALGPYFRAVIDSLDFFLQREDPARVYCNGAYASSPRSIESRY